MMAKPAADIDERITVSPLVSLTGRLSARSLQFNNGSDEMTCTAACTDSRDFDPAIAARHSFAVTTRLPT